MIAGRDPPATPYVAIFTIEVRPGRRDDFLAAMDRAMAQSAREPGLLDFHVLADRDRPDVFTAFDVYADEAAYQAHLLAPHTPRLAAELDGILAGPPRRTVHHLLRQKADFAAGPRP